MPNIKDSEGENAFWSARYAEQRTGWDIGYPSTPLKEYIDQIENKAIKILIPGAGNAYEAEYLHQQGFTNVFVLDISPAPLAALQKRVPDFPAAHLLLGNFFEQTGQYDLIFEQTFFCSFPPLPENREQYAKHMAELLKPGGKLVGVWFDLPLTGDLVKRPFGGTREEYVGYFKKHLKVLVFERCYNSIKPRAGNELFGIMRKG